MDHFLRIGVVLVKVGVVVGGEAGFFVGEEACFLSLFDEELILRVGIVVQQLLGLVEELVVEPQRTDE